MIKLVFTVFIGFFITDGFAQHLTAFHDYRKHFIVFDKGQTRELEHLPVQSFQVGGSYISYITNSGEFKVYHNGETNLLAGQFVSRYFATQNLLVYFIYDQLFVFDHGNTQLLSGNVKSFAIGDSLLAFFNENTRSTHVYYNGRIYDLERSLVGSPVMNLIAGDNLFAYYNNNTKYLKAFYHGRVWNILQTPSRIIYFPGRNMLAYIDKSKNSFHLFYKGEVFDLEDYEPKSVLVGDDLMAYVDNLGALKVFYDGELQTISPFEPDFYDVKDSLLVFAEMGYLKVFYKGGVNEYGNFVPAEYQIQESTLAFIGPNGWLQAFTNGKFSKVTNDLISSYSVDRNVICINTTVNKVKVYYHGELYDIY